MAFSPIQILINAKDNASAALSGVAAKVAALGSAIGAYVGIDAFASSVRSAADFEQAMARIKAATGASAEQMELLKKAAEDASKSSGFSQGEAAAALENLTKAGLDATKAIEVLPAVMDLATAGDVELARSAEYVTQAMAGMSLGADQARRIADVLVKGANESKTAVSAIAEAFSYVAPTAKSAGLSIEDTVAVLGKLADAGIDGSRSGTLLNNVLSQLLDPASQFSTELLEAGIVARDFGGVLQQLAAAGPRAEKAILAVGLEAGPGLRGLLNQGMPALDNLRFKLAEAGGASAESARIMRDTTQGAMRSMSASWNALVVALGTPVLPAVKEQVEKLSKAVREAIADGTIGRFGATLKVAFVEGLEAAKVFVQNFNLAEAKAKLVAFVAEAGARMHALAEAARTASAAMQVIFGIMGAGMGMVSTAAATLGHLFAAVISGMLTGLAAVYQGLSKISFGAVAESYAKAAQMMRAEAGAFMAASDALSARAEEAMQSAADSAQSARSAMEQLLAPAQAAEQATKSVVTAQKSLASATDEVAEATAKATAKAEEKAVADKKAADEAAALKKEIKELRQEYERLIAAGDAQGAAQKLQLIDAATKKLTQSQEKQTGASKKAEEAAQEFDATLQRMGVNSAAAMGRVSGATVAALQNIDKLSDSAKKAGMSTQETARAMEMAFETAIPKADSLEAVAALQAKLKELGRSGQVSAEGMERLQVALDAQKASVEDAIPGIQSLAEALRELGVKPQAELEAMAKKSREAFEAVKNSGTATPREIRQAWKKMAEDSIAANDGVADSTIKSEAAARGFAIETDAAGKSVVKSLSEAKGAAKGVGDEMSKTGEKARDALGNIDYAAQMAGKSMEELEKITRKNWDAQRDLADQAAEHNAAANEMVGAFQKEQQEGSKYFKEMAAKLRETRMGYLELKNAAWAAANALEALDEQQKALEHSGGDAANGMLDLQARLLELDGKEAQVAQLRKVRDQAEVQRKMALLQLDYQRAMIRKNTAEAQQIAAEIAAYQEQLRLLDVVAEKEESLRKRKAHEERKAAREQAEQERQQAEQNHDAAMGAIDSEAAARQAAQGAIAAKEQDLQAEVQKRYQDEDKARAAAREAEDKARAKAQAEEDKAAQKRYEADKKALDDAEAARLAAVAREDAARTKAQEDEAVRAQAIEEARKAREAADRAALTQAQAQAEKERQQREAQAQKDKEGGKDAGALAAAQRQKEAIFAAQKAQEQEQVKFEQARAEAAAAARAAEREADKKAQAEAAAAREKAAQKAHAQRIKEIESAEKERQQRSADEREREAARLAEQRAVEDARTAEARAREEALLKGMQGVAAAVLAGAVLGQAGAAGTPALLQQVQQMMGVGGTGAGAGKERASGTTSGGMSTGAVETGAVRNVAVNLSLAGQSLGQIPTTPAGADTLEQFLQALERAQMSSRSAA